jgi:hypothetical protein
VTEQELAAIEARVGEPDPEAALWREGDTLNQAAARVLDKDVYALIAEVRRLRIRWNDCDDCINGRPDGSLCRCWDDD